MRFMNNTWAKEKTSGTTRNFVLTEKPAHDGQGRFKKRPESVSAETLRKEEAETRSTGVRCQAPMNSRLC